MFDAKKLLDAMMSASQAPTQGLGREASAGCWGMSSGSFSKEARPSRGSRRSRPAADWAT